MFHPLKILTLEFEKYTSSNFLVIFFINNLINEATIVYNNLIPIQDK